MDLKIYSCMENKYVGILVLGITLIFLFIVISFNSALEQIVSVSCVHGPTCPMYTTLETQKYISYGLIGLLILVGTVITFFLKERNVPSEAKKVFSEEEKKGALENLDQEEKRVVELITTNQGSIYQSDLMKETQFTKVKITRILDKLEGKQILERKRRGMTNIVVLK